MSMENIPSQLSTNLQIASHSITHSHLLLFLILFVFLAISFMFFISIIQKSQEAKSRLPPGPRRLPVIGNLHQLRNPIHRSLHHLAHQHGPIMFLKLGSVPTLVVSSASMVKQIFKAHDLVFSGRPVLYSAQKLSYNCSGIAFAPYGEQWKEMRKIAVMELLSAKRVQSFKAAREEEVAFMLDSIDQSSGRPVNLSQLALVLSNNVICRAVFGKNYNQSCELYDLLGEAQELLGGYCIADFFPWMGWVCKFNGLEAKLVKNFREFDKLFDKVMQEHLDSKRTRPEHEDLVDVLLRIQKDPSRQVALSNDSIKGALTDMFIAGTDTNTATLVWTMAELIRNPQVMKRAQEEVRRAIKLKEKVKESDLSQLKYVKSIVKESLRLHPPAPLLVPRETTKDCSIGEYEIPAKTMVFINAASISMDPMVWANPGEFRPERFLESSIDLNENQFELIPFGVGRRGCPGMNFSMVLLELALANLLHRYDWELPQGVTREDMDMHEAIGLTVNKKTHLYLVASSVVPD